MGTAPVSAPAPRALALLCLLLCAATALGYFEEDPAREGEGGEEGGSGGEDGDTASLARRREYSVWAGAWTDCSPINHRALHDSVPAGYTPDVHEVYLGEQRRQVQCRHQNGTFVEPMMCGAGMKSVAGARLCVLERACIAGEWLEWRVQPDGSHVRYRSLERLPQGGGASCAVMTDQKFPKAEPSAHWAPGPWGACEVAAPPPAPAPAPHGNALSSPFSALSRDSDYNGTATSRILVSLRRGEGDEEGGAGRCGGGVQRRRVQCAATADAEAGAALRLLHPVYCEQLHRPALVQPCEVACPRDCEVGEWSSWSACVPPGGCEGEPGAGGAGEAREGHSVRRRRVLVAPSEGGVPCPALLERRACFQPRCALWQPAPWGPCRLLHAHTHAHASCGAGQRTRTLRCVHVHGEEVGEAWCDDEPPPTTEPCRIACAGDCVLSPWGAWGRCSRPCARSRADIPLRQRKRHILAREAPDGWACPHGRDLVDVEPCNAHACDTYAWLPLPWSRCTAPPPPAPRPTPRTRRPPPYDNSTMQAGATPWAVEQAEAGEAAPTVSSAKGPQEEKEGPTQGPCPQMGLTTREVLCMQNNDKIVRPSQCDAPSKPSEQSECELPCRRACRKQPWGSWSACPDACEYSEQERVRGGPCGVEREARACPAPPHCGLVPPGWRARPWSACLLPPAHSCGEGLRIRYVWCSEGGQRVDGGLCSLAPLPGRVLPCAVPCNFTSGLPDPRDPSAPHLHSAANGLQPADPTYAMDCDQICEDPIKWVELVEHAEGRPRQCACGNVTLHRTKARASDCILPHGSTCGRGRSLHAAVCLLRNIPVPMSICKLFHPLDGPLRREGLGLEGLEGLQYDEEEELLRAECEVPCPRDCVPGPWAEWGPCTLHAATLAYFRYRIRDVLVPARDGGRACGAQAERAACRGGLRVPRLRALWVPADVPPCELLALPPCQRRNLTRPVRCVELNGNGEEVGPEQCRESGEPAPAAQLQCESPCGQDCVPSLWSEWGACGRRAGGWRRDRTRVPLRPAGPAGRPCAPLVQAEPCQPHSYTWRAGPFGTCQPLGGSPCGEGQLRRDVRCLRSDGLYVDDRLCQGVGGVGGARPERVRWCYVACGQDCEVGAWGAWGRAHCTCGSLRQLRTRAPQYMARTRVVLAAAKRPGRECPPLRQVAPCPLEPYLDLIAEPLRHCQLQARGGARACGEGATVSRARCRLRGAPFWAATLPPSYCHDNDSLHALATAAASRTFPYRMPNNMPEIMEEACEVECGCEAWAGEPADDSQWGEWGECRDGVRTRRLLPSSMLPRCAPLAYRHLALQWMHCSSAMTYFEEETREVAAQPGSAGAAERARAHGETARPWGSERAQLLLAAALGVLATLLLLAHYAVRAPNKYETGVGFKAASV